MDISKQQGAAAPCAAGEDDLRRINAFTRSPLAAEQVYCFAVRLCDNEVDRDFERFSRESLATLGDLFVGKTGIFDHRWSAEGQTARIYKTELTDEPGRVTAAGDGYCWLKGWAYLLRTEKNDDLIREIEGGIKKEVSVGCAVARSVCSVCGGESGRCEHLRGQEYGGKLCFAELQSPTDAYEWSFVAVPAQREAGVVKRFTGGSDGRELSLLRQQARLGRSYLSALRGEVVRLGLLTDETLDPAVLRRAVEGLDEPSLLALRKGYEARADRLFPVRPQLRPRPAGEKLPDETDFLV